MKLVRFVDELSGFIHSASGCDAAWQVWYIGVEPVSDFSKIIAYRIAILMPSVFSDQPEQFALPADNWRLIADAYCFKDLTLSAKR